MPLDENTGLNDDLWTVQLRDDQMDCVIESLSWLIAQHGKRIETEIRGAFDQFAHEQARPGSKKRSPYLPKSDTAPDFRAAHVTIRDE